MRIWVLHRPASKKPWVEYSTVADSDMTDAPQCPVCGRFTGLLRWNPPFRVELEGRGSVWSDVAFGNTNDLLVSARFADALRSRDIKGAQFVGPTTTARADWHGQMPLGDPAYEVVRAVLSVDAIDDVRSGVVREDGPPCQVCRLAGVITKMERIALSTSSDVARLDLFFARGLPGVLMCSERVVDTASQLTVVGASFVPALDFAIPSL